MKCVVPSQNVKILARAVHSLAKIGDEMFLESTEDGLVFRTINMTKSAFGEFRMCRSFFSSYNYSSSETLDTNCKVTMKSCIGVFKNTHGMDKQVENCEIRIKPESTQIIFQIKYINSSVKKHYLPIIENDQLEAQIPTEAPNQLCASSKFLSAALKNFRQSEDEVTLAVSQDKTTIKNHLEIKRDANLMRTELSYHQNEFENYVVGNPTNVTFCLKELRAVIMFAEPGNLPVLISFSEPGRPIVFQVQNHPAYEANYVVSTLQPQNFNRTSRSYISTSGVIDSPPVAIRTLTNTTKSSVNQIDNSSKTGLSFEEEDPVREPFVRSKMSKGSENRQPFVSYEPEPEAGPSYQKDFSKTIQFEFNLPNTEGSADIPNDTMMRHFEIRRSDCMRVSSPQPSTSKQSDCPSPYQIGSNNVSGVVPESEVSMNMSQASVASVCRVETVIKGMDTSSQPSPELLKTVFSRCFSKDHFLNVLVGHDVVLEENSDREIV